MESIDLSIEPDLGEDPGRPEPRRKLLPSWAVERVDRKQLTVKQFMVRQTGQWMAGRGSTRASLPKLTTA